MLKLKNVKKLKTEVSAMNELFSNSLDKINKEHHKILLQTISNLIQNISQGENIDEIYLREKYLDSTKTSKKVEKTKTVINKSEDLLDKVNIHDKQYYYQNKENGIIYNNQSKKVGLYINNNFVFD